MMKTWSLWRKAALEGTYSKILKALALHFGVMGGHLLSSFQALEGTCSPIWCFGRALLLEDTHGCKDVIGVLGGSLLSTFQALEGKHGYKGVIHFSEHFPKKVHIGVPLFKIGVPSFASHSKNEKQIGAILANSISN